MANPSKLTLYIAAITAGDGVRTLVKPKIIVSSEQVRNVLQKEAPTLLQILEDDQEVRRYPGNVRLPASLETAFDLLLYRISIAYAVFNSVGKKLTVEVMFNDPVITLVAKRGHLDDWRRNDFSYRIVNRRKEAISHASKWAAFDSILQKLNGKICYNHDDVLREMVEDLKTSRRNKDDSSNGS